MFCKIHWNNVVFTFDMSFFLSKQHFLLLLLLICFKRPTYFWFSKIRIMVIFATSITSVPLTDWLTDWLIDWLIVARMQVKHLLSFNSLDIIWSSLFLNVNKLLRKPVLVVKSLFYLFWQWFITLSYKLLEVTS